MRFRYKILMVNIILLSVALGIIGFLMIDKNFKLALNTQIRNAVLENNLVQSSVEYELLDIINTNMSQVSAALDDIGTRVHSGMMSTDSSIYIKYGDTISYASNEDIIPESLFENLSVGSKNYIITHTDDKYQIFVTSVNQINNKNLCIVTNADISEAYNLMHLQIQYFKILLVIILCVCSVIIFFISTFLTHPIEQLNTITDAFAQGDYSARAEIHQKDEIGQLAVKFNHMAAAVSDHVHELQAMIRRREQFVADFTHEIKTPMTSIIGYADMIRSKELSRERQIMASNYIFSEGKRLENMSMKLFDLIYLDRHEIALNDVYTVQFLQEVKNSMQLTLDLKHLVLELNVTPAVISGDKELLKTAFINLLDNARKASSENSRIELNGKCTPDGQYIFQVVDYGIGMSPEDAQKICDEFYMVDKSRSRKEGGAGLGMSLVSIIIARHHAHLDIQSCLGEGTTISVTFDSYRKEEGIDA